MMDGELIHVRQQHLKQIGNYIRFTLPARCLVRPKHAKNHRKTLGTAVIGRLDFSCRR